MNKSVTRDKRVTNYLSCFFGLITALPFFTHASVERMPDVLNQQQQIQQERSDAQIEALTPTTPSIRLDLQSPIDLTASDAYPDETPCFEIQTIKVINRQSLPGYLPINKIVNEAEGRCLGQLGIKHLMSRMQNLMIDRGYVTTRVLVPEQNITSGILELMIVPGYVGKTEYSEQSDKYAFLKTAMPIYEGKLLDLRDIEHGLENIQRLPTVKASVQILPTSEVGVSDIRIDRQQDKFWRLHVGIDNSGSKSTGKYQGTGTLFLDNPLALSDLAYFSWNNDLHGRHSQGTKNLTGHYSFPIGDSLLSFTGSRYDFHQTIAGLTTDYEYSGDNHSWNLQLQHMLHRAATHKTTLLYDVNYRSVKNYIDDTEIEVQRKKNASWKLGIQHKHYFEYLNFDGGVSYQRGTRWFGAKPVAEELFDEGTGLVKIWRFNGAVFVPFQLNQEQFSFSVQHHHQLAVNQLTTLDQFAIGSRYSVRGFDGERTLSADNGRFTRTEFSWHAPSHAYQIYLANDYGVVNGADTEFLLGRHLAGGALGVRGFWQGMSYDVFCGYPFSKPKGFKTDDVMFAFNVSYEI